MKHMVILAVTLAVAVLALVSFATADVPQTINYQGRLTDSTGAPVPDGNYSVTFRIYDDSVGGSVLWQEGQLVAVTNGLFSVLLGSATAIHDSVFIAPQRYLGIQVGTDPEILPRTRLASMPYAHRVATVDSASGGAIKGNLEVLGDPLKRALDPGRHTYWPPTFVTPSIASGNPFISPPPGGFFIHVYDGSGNVVIDLDGSNENGKATIGPSHVNTGPNAFVAGANDTATAMHSTVGGGYGNSVTDIGATVSGGKSNAVTSWHGTVGGGYADTVTGAIATVGGGSHNLAEADSSVIAGGSTNSIAIPGVLGAIGGGSMNYVDNMAATIAGGFADTATGSQSAIGGGFHNLASGGASVIGGGMNNTASNAGDMVGGGNTNTASGGNAVIGGGMLNHASGSQSTVGGGDADTASGNWATVGGGVLNKATNEKTTVSGGRENTASGWYATVGGGNSNSAEADSSVIAGGTSNNIPVTGVGGSIGGGSYNTVSEFYGTVSGGNNNTASAGEATVGGGFGNTAGGEFCVVSGGSNNQCLSANSAIPGGSGNTIQPVLGNIDHSMVFGKQVDARNSYRVMFFDGSNSGRLSLNRDDLDLGGVLYTIHVGTNTTNGNGAYLSPGGTWTNGSSRTFKENFRQLDGQDVLNRLEKLPMESWEYKGTGERHIWPCAEDFHEQFDVGVLKEDDTRDTKYLAAGDIAGVALVGVKELAKQNQELRERIVRLEALVEALLVQQDGSNEPKAEFGMSK